MNNNVFLFKPQAALTAEANLANFITQCKKLTVFGSDEWDENSWKTNLGARKVTARFSTKTKPSTSYKYEPLMAPFLDFSKAYIKYIYSHKPVTNLQRHFEAIRVLEATLLDVNGKANILDLDGLVLERLDVFFKEQIGNATGLNKAGYQMELLFDFCRKNFIAPSLPEWTNPYKKEKDLTITLDDKGKEHRSDKLPSDEDMMLVADLFRGAPNLDIETEYYTAIMALLMAAPSRGSEPLILPVNCLVWEKNRAGEKKLGIQWVAAKKGKAQIKWVPTVMQDAVVEAVARLTRISEPARLAAKFAEDNPNVFMPNKGCITPEGFSDTSPLSVKQLNAALSLNLKRFTMVAPTPKWLISILGANNNEVNYQSLGQYEYTKYTKKFNNWPYIDKAKHIKASDSLLLLRENELHQDFSPREYSFVLPTVNNINDRFVQKDSRDGRSLWSKHGISKADGTQIQIQSHNARHWLSTKSETGGMDEISLANWAGRAHVSDNAKYDHRTEEDKANATAALTIPLNATPLDKIKFNIPVSFQDIGKDLPGSAIVTELGVCEHDYAMLPCQRDGDCETCKELVCIKGMDSSLELLKKREKEVSVRLKKSQQNHEMGTFGADRWVSAQGWRLAHLRTKIKILEDDNTPYGMAVRIPDEYDPSPIKESLRNKGLDIGIRAPEPIKIIDEDLLLSDEASDLFDMMEEL